MPVKTHPIFMTFAGGELSPKMQGRIDFDRYFSGASKMQNWLCTQQGGAQTAPGTRFVSAQGDETKRAKLIPFVYSAQQPYMIEAGHEYMRFYKDGAQILESVDADTALLLHGDGSEGSTIIIDDGATGHIITAHGNAKISTTQKVFGTGSIYFDGVDSYLTVPDHADFDLSGGTWTIDFRLKLDSLTGDRCVFWHGTNSSNFMWIYRHTLGSSPLYRNAISFQIVSGGGVVVTGGASESVYGEWGTDFLHVALVEDGDDYHFFVNGQLKQTVTDTDRPANYTGSVCIGAANGTASYLKGWVDEFHIRNGEALWTESFTIPSQAYPLPGETSTYEIESPYQEEDLPKLRYVANDFQLILTHPDYPPMVLTRDDHNDWTLEEIEFIDGPYEDEINSPELTPSYESADGTEKVTNGGFDADSDWIKGGADWTIAGGKAVHAATDSNTLSQNTGGTNGEIYRVIFTLSGLTAGKSVTVSIGGVAGTARAANGTYTEYITATGGGNLTFTPEDASTACEIDDVSVVRVITLTAASALFDLLHVGSLWRIKHTSDWGYVIIESYVSSTVVRAITLSDLDGSGTAAAVYREGAWSDINGWPASACFHEGRLIFLGSYEWPATVWASKTNNFFTMTPGTEDDDPYVFTLSDVDVLHWGMSGKYLCLGAYSGEATAIGSNDDPITPTSPPKINTETSFGSANIAPVKASRSIVYLQRAGRKVLEFAYEYTTDSYQPNDLTILADHLTEAGIDELAFQQEPIPIIWARRKDGAIIGCTFDKQQKIVGWHEHTTAGEYESIASIPGETEDQVWVTVKREIDGAVHRYVEYFDSSVSVHSGLTYSGSEVASVGGLDHLVGEEVQIVGDGVQYESQTVPVSGILEIDPVAAEITVGLPVTRTLITNRPEVQVQGTSMPLKKRWNKILVRVIDTLGITVNGHEYEMGDGREPVSGDIKVEHLGWDTDGKITILQERPFPAYVVCIFGDLVVGDV